MSDTLGFVSCPSNLPSTTLLLVLLLLSKRSLSLRALISLLWSCRASAVPTRSASRGGWASPRGPWLVPWPCVLWLVPCTAEALACSGWLLRPLLPLLLLLRELGRTVCSECDEAMVATVEGGADCEECEVDTSVNCRPSRGSTTSLSRIFSRSRRSFSRFSLYSLRFSLGG